MDNCDIAIIGTIHHGHISISLIINQSTSTRIVVHDWITVTIRKHIASQEALTRRSKGIRIDESANTGIVISALQIVEPGFSGGAVAVVVFTGIL